jgi:tetratricopeptide (TPR) repeat protein
LIPRRCRDLLMSFRQRSLIDFDQSTRRMTLHDLLHNFAAGMAERRFGSTVKLHRRLLDAYRKVCPHGWASGPNDGYFLQSLIGHLLAADETKDAVALLIGSTSEWMTAQHAASGGSVAFADDLALALEINPDVLTRISLHAAREAAPAQPRHYDDDDLRVLVSLGREREARDSVRSRVDPEQQCKGWITLYNTVRGRQPSLGLLELAVQEAKRILTEYPRGTVMEEITTVLARDGAIEQARETGLAIGSPWHRASALKKIAASMAQEDQRIQGVLIDAATAAREVDSPSDRARLLAEIAEECVRIGDSQAEFLLDEALKAATEEDVPWKWSSAYKQVVSGWARLQRVDRILEIVDQIKHREDVRDVHQCLVEIAKLLAAEKMPDVALQLKEWAVSTSSTALPRHQVLSEIALALSQAGDDRADQVFSEALEQATHVEFSQRAAALKDVGVNMYNAGDGRAAGTMLQGQMVIQNGELDKFAEAYADIGEFDAAMDCATRISEYWRFSITVSRISTAATFSATPGRALAVVERIARTRAAERTLDDVRRLSYEFAHIASDLADSNDITLAMETIKCVDMPLPRADALGHIALALAKQGDPAATSTFTEALRELTQEEPLEHPYEMKQMSKLLVAASDPRASEVFDQACAAADKDRDEEKSADARKHVAIALASTGLFSRALAIANYLPESTKQRAEALKEIAISLAEACQFDKAISVAHSIKDGISGGATVCNSDTRAEALCRLAKILRVAGDVGKALEVLDSALGAAGTIASVFSWHQAAILEDAAIQFAQSGRTDQAREVAYRIPHQVRVPRTLAAVAMEMDRIHSGCGSTVQKEAIKLADQIQDAGERTEALCDTALVISKAGGRGAERLLERAYDSALATDKDRRAYRLGQVGKALAESGNVKRALELAQRPEVGWQGAEVLRIVFKSLRLAGDHRANDVFQTLSAEVHEVDTYMGARDHALKDAINDLTELGDIEAAIELLGEMSIDSYSSLSTDAANLIARSVAKTGDFQRALSVLDLKEPRLSDFIGNMGTWAEAFELAEKGLSFKVLLAVCRIGGWVSPVWQRTHQILSGKRNGTRDDSVPVMRGFSSIPHPSADPERAVRMNLEYQTAKREWGNLPIWKRMFTKKPLPPSGI